ncbi:MAG TPA: tetratricopeptide repeat protein, partial [Thermoanaerobaculia bacterium]|nr:tetratricopeptide repeat protein [Thermoanaerobaculia bacterium]
MRKRLALSLLGFGLALTVQAQTPPAHSSATPASPPAAGSSLEKSLDRALAKADKGDEAGAIQILEGLRKDPAVTPPVLSLLGGLYLKTNRPKEAMELLKPLADAEDADPAVLFNTARAAFALGQKAEGVQYLERSVALAPASPAARALGLFLAREGQPEQAYDILLPWVAATPDDFEARLAAALLAVNLQHFADAEKLLKGMPKNNPRVELLAGDLALRQGNPKASIATLRPLVDNPPPGFDTNSGMEADARRLLAEAYLRTGQPNDAIKLLSGREKGDPATALLLAQAQFQGGATPAALATLSPWTDKILKADKPRDPELVVKMAITYGRILTAAGRLEEAATAIGVATRLDPGSPEAWDAYGKTLAAQGKKEDSAKALARSQVLVAARARGKVESRLASA